MKRYKQNKFIYSAFLSLCLLLGQWTVLVHAQEHPFHDAHHSCDIFIAAEQIDANSAVVTSVPVLSGQSVVTIRVVVSVASLSFDFYQPRAPPVLS